MDVENVIEYWIKGSEEDYKTAKALIDSKRFAHALFFCHLTIEKTLKALVVKHTQKHARLDHNLIRLSESTGLSLSEEQLNALTEINSFNISGRYDDEKFEFHKKATQEFTEKYFNETTNLYLWLKKQLTK